MPHIRSTSYSIVTLTARNNRLRSRCFGRIDVTSFANCAPISIHCD